MTDTVPIGCDLKIIRFRGNSGLRYSLRWVDGEGVETEIIASGREASLQPYIEAVRHLESRPDVGKLAVMLASILITIGPYANRIRDAVEDQGKPGYATKQHMRAWAEDILHYVGAGLDHTGILKFIEASEPK